MVFVIVDSEKAEKTLLVKAATADEIEQRLKLKDTQSIVGAYTDIEIRALDTQSFAIISA